MNLTQVSLAKTLPRSTSKAGEYLVLPPRRRETVIQVPAIKSSSRPNDADVLIDVPFAEIIWNDRAASNRSASDVQ